MLRPTDITVTVSLTDIGVVANSTRELVQDVRLKVMWYRVFESKNATQSSIRAKNNQKFAIFDVLLDVLTNTVANFEGQFSKVWQYDHLLRYFVDVGRGRFLVTFVHEGCNAVVHKLEGICISGKNTSQPFNFPMKSIRCWSQLKATVQKSRHHRPGASGQCQGS